MARVISAFKQYFDDSGDPLVDGWLKFNFSGTNNTDKETFADINETILNANPLQLSGAGRAPNIFGSGSYNIISYQDNNGVPGAQIEQFDPVTGDATGVAFVEWDAATIYGIGDIVIGSDDLYYRSLITNNQNQDPISSPAQWENFKFVGVWNTNVTYAAGDAVYASDGLLYASRTASNLANDPTTDTTNWRPGANIRFVKGANLDDTDIDGSNILTLGTDGNQFDMDGTQDIDVIATVGVGTIVKLKMNTVRKISHHATNLILPGGIPIMTVVDDEWELFEYAAGDWKVLNIFSPNAPYKASVRQTVLTGVVAAATGFANFISAGSGLACDLAATATPVVIGAAKGFGSYGDLNSTEIIAADLASAWSGLPANSNNFLYRDLAAGLYGNVQNLPAVYGPTYVKADGVGRSYVNFDGADAATTDTEENPNIAWTFSGNAQLDTAQKKFGSASLLLDGTGDYITSDYVLDSASGRGGFKIDFWFRTPSLAANQCLWTAEILWGSKIIIDTSGNLVYSLTSAAGSYDIINAVAGSGTVVVDTWYHFRLHFDGSTYKGYLDGVEDISQASSLDLLSGATAYQKLGANDGSTEEFNGWLDDFSLEIGPQTIGTFTPPTTAHGGLAADTEHWFDTTRMVMSYWDRATAAWIDVQRVFMGECVTDASSVTSTITYALRGEYESELFTIAADTLYSKSHNLGIKLGVITIYVECILAEYGYVAGDRIAIDSYVGDVASSGVTSTISTRNVADLITGVALSLIRKDDFNSTGFTFSSWNALYIIKRGW